MATKYAPANHPNHPNHPSHPNHPNRRSARGPISNRSAPLNIRYKEYLVASASFNLLITFLLRKLNWLSHQTDEQLSAATKWASLLLEAKGQYVPFFRNSITEFCEQMTIDYPESTTTYCIGGRNNVDAETGKTYTSIYWLNGPVRRWDETNHVKLPDATLYELLDQICLRLTNLSKAIEYADIQGVVDVDAMSQLEDYLFFFDKTRTESESFSEQIKKFEKEFHANKMSTPPGPKKIILPNAMRQRTVVPHKPGTPIKVFKPKFMEKPAMVPEKKADNKPKLLNKQETLNKPETTNKPKQKMIHGAVNYATVARMSE